MLLLLLQVPGFKMLAASFLSVKDQLAQLMVTPAELEPPAAERLRDDLEDVGRQVGMRLPGSTSQAC